MSTLHLSAAEARDLVRSPDLHRLVGPAFSVPAVMVHLDGSDLSGVATALATLPVVSVAVFDGHQCGSEALAAAEHRVPWDLIASDPDPLANALERNPIAATTAALVLRGPAHGRLTSALQSESFAYSMLQTGPEHQRWLDARGRHTRDDSDQDRVEVRDLGDHLEIAMTRSRLFNLIDSKMRDQLADAFRTVAHDTRPIRFVGRGRAFCAGGDPAEFGTADSPANAALVRIGLGVAPWIAAVADRVTAVIDGACVGAGVELAAFAGRVLASPTASFKLPELTMGLIPGAGGTHSIPARIGSRCTLGWLLRNTEVDAHTALRWGLVDEVTKNPQ